MNSFILPLLMGMPQGGDAAGGAGLFTSMIPFALIIGIFYFLIIRPQSKKRKETESMLKAIRKGDRVVTIGGMHGTVTNVRETTVIIKVDDSTKLEFSRSAISSVQAPAVREEREDKEEKSEEKEETSEAENTKE
jgi:preprotein translocase subunit YajC